MSTAGKDITCKAAVAWEPHKPLSIETITVAPPKAHEVRIQILASGVCGSDSSVLKQIFCSKFPVILGHEAVGVVESVGPEVTSIKPGDKVIPLSIPQCESCRACKSSNSNFCAKNDMGARSGLMADMTSRFTCKGKTVYNLMGTSTFTEYTVVADIAVAKIDPQAPLETCLIGCGFATGYGGAVNTAKVTPGSTCAVFGLGGVGFSAIVGCKAAGASRIIGVGTHKDKFPKAIELGATECLDPKDYDKPIYEVICEKTNGGVDYAIECVGRIETMMNALQSTYCGSGVTAVLGISSPNERIPLDPLMLLTGRTLKGSVFGGFKGDEVAKLVDDYMKNKINLSFMVSSELKLDQINEAFDLLRSGKGIRTIIRF
ncbi:NADP-dependent alcohol dehydrogenase-like [Lithobates pipiens]